MTMLHKYALTGADFRYRSYALMERRAGGRWCFMTCNIPGFGFFRNHFSLETLD